jgi:predicted nucleic acid-binding protein
MSLIVVDADIMRAAGVSEKPNAANARMILESIQQCGHYIVMAKPINDEYKRHQSKFAGRWKNQMISQMRAKFVHYKENPTLRALLIQALPDDNDAAEAAVIKDAHLLEVALEHGQRIVSKDKKAKNNFQHACAIKGDHRSLLWADATEKPTEVIEWIKNGCTEQNEWRLCPAPPKPARKKAKR